MGELLGGGGGKWYVAPRPSEIIGGGAGGARPSSYAYGSFFPESVSI